MTEKQYDRSYFNRWYRGPGRITTPTEVRRKVTLAVTTAEYFLRRQLRSVLDIGCGEGAWRPHLRALRPRVSYLGIDPSAYVVERYGVSRNIIQGGFGDLPKLAIKRSFDLIVCSDVLHYVSDDDIRTGMPELVELLDGLAFIEVLTAEDDIVGDLDSLTQRPAKFYRKLFASVGLIPAGPYSWIGPMLRDDAAELEVMK